MKFEDCPACADYESNQSDACLEAQYGNGCEVCDGFGNLAVTNPCPVCHHHVRTSDHRHPSHIAVRVISERLGLPIPAWAQVSLDTAEPEAHTD